MDGEELATVNGDEECLEPPVEALKEADYNPKSFTPKKQQIFLREFSKRCNASEAARIADIPKSTAIEARERSEIFDELYELCQEFAYEKLEAEAYERAKNGKVIAEQYDEDGNVTQRRKKYSDKLMETLLRAHKPQKYEHKEEKEHNINIQWQGPGEIEAGDQDALEDG